MNQPPLLGLALLITRFSVGLSLGAGLMAGNFRRVFASLAAVMTVPVFCNLVRLNRRRAAIA